MFTVTIAKAFSPDTPDETLVTSLEKMVEWSNNLKGTEVKIPNQPEGVVDSVKSLSHSIINGEAIICVAVVNARETNGIVEE